MIWEINFDHISPSRFRCVSCHSRISSIVTKQTYVIYTCVCIMYLDHLSVPTTGYAPLPLCPTSGCLPYLKNHFLSFTLIHHFIGVSCMAIPTTMVPPFPNPQKLLSREAMPYFSPTKNLIYFLLHSDSDCMFSSSETYFKTFFPPYFHQIQPISSTYALLCAWTWWGLATATRRLD